MTDKNVRREEYHFPSANGISEIHAVAFVPERDPKGYVQILHDTYEHTEIYEEVMEDIANRGYIVFSHDQMGHGASVTKREELGIFPGEKAYLDILKDTNTAFMVLLQKYSPEVYADYLLMQNEEQKKQMKEIRYVLRAVIGVGFGSAVLKNYLMMYEDVNCAVFIGDRGLQGIREKLLQIECDLELNRYGREALPLRLPGNAEKNYLKGKDDSYRFNWKANSVTGIRKIRNDPACNFEYDLGAWKDILTFYTAVSASEWLDAYPPFLATLVLSGEKDPVNNGSSDVKKMVRFMKSNKCKNLFARYYDAYHNLLIDDCHPQVIHDILSVLNAVRNQQFQKTN